MQSSTLYRKYRPQSFDDVIGQDDIVKTLQKSIINKSIGHAYLFSGGRGTGKTSIARIFARELGTSDQDIYEIDAASNRKIEHIREIRDGVSTIPFSSDYKVYIIDEVHMLTKEAFNALLKTLEEPPAHVIFILATTEKNKVPDTILSRCQVYDFSLGSALQLQSLIAATANSEGIEIDQQSIDLIAKQGNGSYRDTLSALQKVISTADKVITYETTQHLLQTSDVASTPELLLAIADADTSQSILLTQALFGQNITAKDILKNLIENTRMVLQMRYSPPDKKRLSGDLNPDMFSMLESATTVTSKTLLSLLDTYDRVLSTQLPNETLEAFIYSLDTSAGEK